jgi:hypothetical protein
MVHQQEGPIDIVVENTSSLKIQVVGYPMSKLKDDDRPKLKSEVKN